MEVEDNRVLEVDGCCRLQRSPLKKLPYTIPPYTTRLFAGGRAALHDVVDEAPAPAPAEYSRALCAQYPRRVSPEMQVKTQDMQKEARRRDNTCPPRHVALAAASLCASLPSGEV